MQLKEKKLSIAKEIGIKTKATAKPAAAKPVKSLAIRKTEKSLENIGNEFVNIGMYVGGRRFLNIWAGLSLLFAVVGATLYPSNWTVSNAEFYPLLGDKLYFYILGALTSIPALFMVSFIPMAFLVIAVYYMFVNWKLPLAARPKMSAIFKKSLIGSAIAGAITGIALLLFSTKIISNTLMAGISYFNILVFSIYVFVALTLASIAILSLYKELTFMLGKKD